MNNKHDISSAIYVIQTAAELGYSGLQAFALRKEKPHILLNSFSPEDETYEEFIERIATACWMGSDYFRMWLGDENIPLKKHHLTNLNLTNLDNGVYYMEFMGNETHYWVWIIDDEYIWYAGTYGGVCNVTVKKFHKLNYNERFIRAMNGSMDDYAYIFQVDPEVYKVNYKSITYMKSESY